MKNKEKQSKMVHFVYIHLGLNIIPKKELLNN